MHDIIIKNGTIFDGSGKNSFCGDIGIHNQTIETIGDLSGASANHIIDATDKIVCPGFIDVHTHSDAYLLIEPSSPSKIFQGVTTEIVGNCGASASPLLGKYKMPSDWASQEYPQKWSSVAEYRNLLENIKPAVNVYILIGHNTLHAGTVGYASKKVSSDELKTMQHMLEKCLDEGARGLSTGLIYPPGMYASKEEIEELASVVSKHNGIYTSHMRSEGSNLLRSIKETISIAEKTGCRTQISHLKTAGPANWHLADQAIDLIREGIRRSLPVAADRYPYTASCTDMDVILPDWAEEGGREEILKRLNDTTSRKKIRDEIKSSRNDDYWERVNIGTVNNPDYQQYKGQPLFQVAQQLDMEPVDAVLHLITVDNLCTGGIFFGMSEENMWKFYKEPYVMVGSDASLRSPVGPLSSDHPHPRAYGTFPRFIRSAMDGKTVSLPEAIRKATSLPAEQFNIPKRGLLKKDYYADLIILDTKRYRDLSTFEKPHQLATGIEAMIVNGVETIIDGKLTGQRAGVVC